VDVAAGTSYSLYRDGYPPPRGVRKLGTVTSGAYTDMVFAQLSDLNYLNRRYVSAGVPRFWSCTGSADYLGLHADTEEKRRRARKDRQVLFADNLGNMASSVVMTGVDTKLAASAAGDIQQFFIRAGTRYGAGVQGQRLISGAIIDPETNDTSGGTTNKTANDITRFNNYWFAGRMATEPFISKFISSELPAYAYNACKSGSLLRIVINPGVVRLVERAAITTLYFGLRRHFTGN
jgi:hypothetical protein